VRKVLGFVVFVAAAVSATYAQVQVVKERDNPMKTTVGILPEMAKPIDLAANEQPMRFLLHSTKEFVRSGDMVDLTLISMVSSTETFGFFFTKICRAGLNGEVDGKQGGCANIQPYISYSGWKAGVQIGERIKIYNRVFNQEDLRGKYVFSTTVYNNAGVKLQSVSAEFYLTDTGEEGSPYFISKMEFAPDGRPLIATGKFRVGAPYYCMVGVPTQGFVIWGNNPAYASYSSDGVTLHLDAMVWYYRATYLDIVAQSPGHPTLNKPGAIVAPAYVP